MDPSQRRDRVDDVENRQAIDRLIQLVTAAGSRTRANEARPRQVLQNPSK